MRNRKQLWIKNPKARPHHTLLLNDKAIQTNKL